MAKFTGSYEKVMLGVSQQTPQDRRQGQHWDQVNCLSDIVRGVVRRHGSKHESTRVVGEYLEAGEASFLADVKTYRSEDFLVGDDRYTLVYRKNEQVAGSTAPYCFCFNKQTRQFIPVVSEGGSTLLNALFSGGTSALTNIGRYLYIAGNDISPAYNVVDNVNSNANREEAVAWVKSGMYAKTYKLTVYLRNVSTNTLYTIYGEYQTMPAQYPVPLDTSSISYADPEYQKLVNDATNAYNGAVTAHIIAAAEDVLQANIAQKVKESVEADRDSQSLTSALTLEISGSTIGLVASSGYIIESIVAKDSGDGTSFVGVDTEVGNVEDLSAEHYNGKIVKIKPKKSDESDSYYMKAVKRADDSVIVGLQEVTWIQAAGHTTTIESMFAFATVESGTFYIAGSPSGLETISGLTEVPGFETSKVGDTLTTPIPAFLGERIHYLGSFQDRLVVGFKSTLTFSRPGRYLDFFRQDVLSVIDDDPVEIYPMGAEDDTIKNGVQFQGSVLLFGDRKQYLLSGKQKFTPQTGLIITVGSHEDSIDMAPVAAGNFVFYAKGRLGYSSVHQFQGGAFADTPESFDISAQVDRYMPGSPVEALAITTPNTIFLRTDGVPNSVFLYNYLDAADGSNRLFDSWSRWEWDPQLGQVVGWTHSRGDISIFTVRHGLDWDDQDRWFLVSDKFTMETKVDSEPYLDSLRSYNTYVAEPADEWFIAGKENAFAAYDSTVNQHLIGQPLALVENLTTAYPSQNAAIKVGFGYDAWFSPTNPYIRDNQGKAIVDARTTINQFVVSVSNTAAIEATVHTKANPDGYQAGYTNGRELGRLTAELGVQPISTGNFRFLVGRENTEFEYKLKAIKWFPMTVSAITWVGQFFSRARRIT